MRMMNQNEESTKACLQFYHKGYVISASSFMGKFVEVGYWQEEGDNTFFRADSIPEAIYAIDNLCGKRTLYYPWMRWKLCTTH